MKATSLNIISLSSQNEHVKSHIEWLAKNYLNAVKEEMQHSWLKDHRQVNADQMSQVIDIFEQCSKNIAHSLVLIGQINQQNVAYFVGLIKDNIAEVPKQTGYINGLYVLPDYRHQGFGSLLLTEAKKWFQDRSIQVVELYVSENNKQAAHFWEKHGYKVSEKIYSTII